MSDLIDREELLKKFEKERPTVWYTGSKEQAYHSQWVDDYEIIRNFPSAQVVAKKGKWIEIEPHMVICPFCKHASSRKNFCAECGADMRDNSDE